MARYKYIDTNPKFLPVDLSRQLLPGTFEHALHHLLEHELDLSRFDARFRNDETGAPAYPPAVLLKVVLFAYARGIVSSRAIARACTEHVTFIALCGDQAPHFTTIAHFVSTLGDEIAHVFAAVVAICDRQGLIGREMFAIDGVKLPSNASKQRSGTRADFVRQAEKLEAAAQVIVQRHRAMDELPVEPDLETKAQQRVTRLQQDAAKLRTWLATHLDDRRGPTGGIRKSNRTDNDSANMATGKGVIQGDTGVAAVDDRTQIIVVAQAHGTGAEAEVLLPVVEALTPLLAETSLLTADAGYHSETNLQVLEARDIDALIADAKMRQRDERFATQVRHQQGPDVLHDKSQPAGTATRPAVFRPRDFTYDPCARTCVCPAGKSLYRKGQARVIKGFVGEAFRGAARDCRPCALRAQCLRTPDTTPVRNVVFIRGRASGPTATASARMRQRIDHPTGRARYGRRFATVEPVFANLRYNKRLTRFTLRGRDKVDGQWQLFCLVHNIEKLAHHGYAA
jgi:transposase